MTEREEFDVWFDSIYDRESVADSLIGLAFHFWCAGRQSVIAASGAAVEIRALAEPQ
ncbi:hypothetical protein [Paraburkholderia sp.]|uniref:hypothetical protein n=1 Tax=Paraburkholderia sp. TaxID=1926495 RepID=UPI00286EF58E|nr:hypothetical protein [Paraburkholderia sp.]